GASATASCRSTRRPATSSASVVRSVSSARSSTTSCTTGGAGAVSFTRSREPISARSVRRHWPSFSGFFADEFRQPLPFSHADLTRARGQVRAYAPIRTRISRLASSLHSERGMRTKCPLPKGFSGTRRVSGMLFIFVALSLIAASTAIAAPFAYISNFGSANVSVIDAGATASCGGPNQVAPPPCVVATVPVGSFPGGIAVNPAGTFAYVANQDDGTVSVIRTSDNTVVGGPIPVGVQPWGVAVTADNALVYVGLGNGGIAVIDANNGNSVSVISGVG